MKSCALTKAGLMSAAKIEKTLCGAVQWCRDLTGNLVLITKELVPALHALKVKWVDFMTLNFKNYFLWVLGLFLSACERLTVFALSC